MQGQPERRLKTHQSCMHDRERERETEIESERERERQTERRKRGRPALTTMAQFSNGCTGKQKPPSNRKLKKE